MYFEINGKQVFATTGGKPFDISKPTVVFLHGSGFDHTVWALQSRFFAFRGYSVLALDLPGHTRSEGPPLESIEVMADWLHDIFESLDINNVSLVAHSQGCLVGLELASRYPDRLRSASFLTSGLETPVNDALLNAAREKPESAISMMLSWGFGSAGHLHQGPIPGNSMVSSGRRIMRGNTPDALSTDLHACNNYKNGVAAAEKVSCPTQVIVGGKDRMAPGKATDKLIKHLSSPAVAVIRESGHIVPQEAPNKCRTLLKDFIFENNPTT
jgi:pimeloyl-ACP methyl ester carboxylesterase